MNIISIKNEVKKKFKNPKNDILLMKKKKKKKKKKSVTI